MEHSYKIRREILIKYAYYSYYLLGCQGAGREGWGGFAASASYYVYV
jgi:hypothetical protein